jgi:hypothetical protein
MSETDRPTNPGHDEGTLSPEEEEVLAAAIAQQARHGCPRPATPAADIFLSRRRGQRLFIILLLLVVLLLGVWGAGLLVFGTLYSPRGAVKEFHALLREYDGMVNASPDSPRWKDFQTRSRRVAQRYADRFRRSATDRPSHARLLDLSENLWPKLIEAPPAEEASPLQTQIMELLAEVEKLETDPAQPR